MKALTLTISLAATIFSAAQAHALIQVPGTFAAAQCGPQTYEAVGQRAVESVCIGMIVGQDVPMIEFRLSDGSAKLFRIDRSANLLVALKSGNIKSNLFLVADDGEQTTMRVIQDRHGHILSASGQLGPAPYFVPEMQPVFSMQ